jgi:DNA primase
MIDKDTVDKIKSRAKLEDFISDLKPAGKDLYTKCPFCGKSGKSKGLIISPAKQIWKCFSCDKGGTGAISYLMEAENIEYPEALRKIADHYGIIVHEEKPVSAAEQPAPAKKPAKRPKKNGKSFCENQLTASGLTAEDVMASVKRDDKTEVEFKVFKQGTRDQFGRILVGEGDDMLIYYFDLDGKPVQYRSEKGNKFYDLVRVRWQNPDLHLDKEGKGIKYQSPKGSGSHLYIPEKVRKLYKNRRKIHTLYIQEGEKKAEKCCKHGLPSVGIMGIQNLGHKNQLPPELQLIIQQCDVENVFFMLDSDWQDLSNNLRNGQVIEQRPKSFFYAVKNYRDYMRTLVNMDIAVEIWFGHVKPNEDQLKGIDDLLAGKLKGIEDKMKDDLKFAMHDKEGIGEYVQAYKITMWADSKLADLWHLNDAEKFAEEHRTELKDLKEFVFKKIKRRFNEDGKLEMAQPIMPYEQFWTEEVRQTRAGERVEINFDYANCFTFLQNRGYWRIRMKSGNWEFVRIENKVVEVVDNYDVKDFVTDFTKELKKKEVLNMIYRGGPQYLGHEKLSNLEYTFPLFEKAEKTSQCLFFKDKIWEINADGVKELQYGELKQHVWKDKIINFDAEILPEKLIDVIPVTKENQDKYPGFEPGDYFIDLKHAGSQCHFLMFLLRASDFYKRDVNKRQNREHTEKEIVMIMKHFLNKLTALGYLLHDYKNESELKAVICMDARMSEVGASNGRTGKSLFGRAVEQVIPQVYIAAKNKKITEDNFLFGEVNEKTKNVFLDDVRANIDFEFFFPLITGKLKVNPKGAQPFTLQQNDTPKLLITTNHAINGEGASFRDRQAFVAFSDYYDDNHKPIDDYGINFFSEWGKDQWNLFYNLMATCLQLYFRSIKEGWAGQNQGILEPPMESLEKRKLRQLMGEDFLIWADSYFSRDEGIPDNPDDIVSTGYLNKKVVRKDAFNDLLEKNFNMRKWMNPSNFGKRIKYYCKYKGYHFNPNKRNRDDVEFTEFRKIFQDKLFYGEPDKSAGVEYLTIADDDYLIAF